MGSFMFTASHHVAQVLSAPPQKTVSLHPANPMPQSTTTERHSPALLRPPPSGPASHPLHQAPQTREMTATSGILLLGGIPRGCGLRWKLVGDLGEPPRAALGRGPPSGGRSTGDPSRAPQTPNQSPLRMRCVGTASVLHNAAGFQGRHSSG